ncbi:hypothetical protein MPL1032_180058 [Mesorhizobium plurifarium]|uniref:Uncharacterized protein n=1 Tax=Mesorhizobium plurifarium TaxID=69974 RepID=A0A0K2VTD7_MESPL|nr:hypothetical protein MPL1032_180058 [Mesorhizobium plurifarium]
MVVVNVRRDNELNVLHTEIISQLVDMVFDKPQGAYALVI